jgi:hypothetical protein
MPVAVVRRFTLADVMILVASAAVGLVLWRFMNESGGFSTGLGSPWLLWLGLELTPFLLVTAIGLLVVRVRPPRPPTWRILRQPGTVACLVVLANTIVSPSLTLAREFVAAFLGRPALLGAIRIATAALYSGHSVAIAWAVLALARAWRPEPSWIDRAGRCFGVFLIALWLLLSLGF